LNPRTKKIYFGVVALAFFTLIVGVFGAVPADTIRTDTTGVSTIVVDNLNVTDTYYWTHGGTTYNMTEAVSSLLDVNATNEWGLVYGTTGDWFDYTELSGATPVYIGLQIHPLNHTIGGDLVIPEVYDKDATHWQLGLYWLNGSQCSKDCLVMYYAHIDWSNPTGLTYLEPNEEPE